jgi:hypothetical protein
MIGKKPQTINYKNYGNKYRKIGDVKLTVGYTKKISFIFLFTE